MSQDPPNPPNGDDPTVAPNELGEADTMMATTKPTTVPSQPTPLASGSYVPGGVALSTIESSSYEISGEFARGGLGRILRAKDRRLGRPVAIKELLRSRGRAAERFIREALVTARLQHPAIVPVYEAGHWPTGEPFYSMKLVNGRSLDQVIASAKNLSERLSLLPVVINVCEAMAYAHSEKIIHRDLKPANILVGSFGETVVIDWGLAKDLTPAARAGEAEEEADESELADAQNSPVDLTAVGSVMGTPAFMPPEQARGESVDERADVYALGAILYHLLSGLPPYGGNSSTEVLKNVLSGPPMPLEQLESEVAPDLLAIIHKAMARDPAARYPSARELAEDVLRFQTGKLVAAHQYSIFDLTRRFFQKHRGILAIGTAMALLLIGIAFFSVVAVLKERNRANLDLLTAMGHAAEAELARLHAESSQAKATKLADDLLFSEARASLSTDPGQSIAWLKQLSLAPSLFSSMRFAALQASVRGISEPFPLPQVPLFVAFSRDDLGVLLVDQSEVRLFDLKHRELNTLFKLPTSAPRLVAYSAEQSRIAVADATGNIFVFSPREPMKHLIGHTHLITHLAFLPDQSLASSDQNGELRLWPLSEAEPTSTLLQKFPFSISLFDVNPRGDLFAVICGSALRFVPRDTTVITPDIHTDESLTSARFSPDGELLAIAGQNGFLQLWHLGGVPILHSLKASSAQTISALEFSLDSRALIATSQGGYISLWDTAHGELLYTAPLQQEMKRLSQSSALLIASGDGAALWSWDWSLQEARYLLGHKEPITASALSNNGSLLASVSQDKTLRIWRQPAARRKLFPLEARKGRTMVSVGGACASFSGFDALVWSSPQASPASLSGHADFINEVALSPDGKHLASASQDKTIRLWSLMDGKAEQTLSGHSSGVSRVIFSADGRSLVSADNAGELRLWSLRDGSSLVLQREQGLITALALSPQGIIAASRDADKIRLWDLSGASLGELTGHTAEISSLTFSPDGGLLASAASDKSVRLWELNDRKLWGSPLLHDDNVSSMRFSPDGTRLATIGEDEVIYLWELQKTPATGRELRGHLDVVTSIAFSPDGRQLLSGSYDSTLRLWDLASNEAQILYEGQSPVWSVSFLDADSVGAANDQGVLFWHNELPLERASLNIWLGQLSNTIQRGEQ